MSMNSGLLREKNGSLTRAGKTIILTCDTGDDTPVVQDERLDIDLNRLVSNEMARQDTLRIPGDADYADLTEYPVSRGDAEHRALDLRRRLNAHIADGENYETALKRLMEENALALRVQREQNAKASEPPSNPSTNAPSSAQTPTPRSFQASRKQRSGGLWRSPGGPQSSLMDCRSRKSLQAQLYLIYSAN